MVRAVQAKIAPRPKWVRKLDRDPRMDVDTATTANAGPATALDDAIITTAGTGTDDDAPRRQRRLYAGTEDEAQGTSATHSAPRGSQWQHPGLHARQFDAVQQLRVLSWNVAKSKPNAALAQADRGAFGIIAIQEPWLNQTTKAPYCPSRGHYRCVHGSGRAAILVHKRHERSTWKETVGKDWCAVTFGRGPKAPTVWCVYSPNPLLLPWRSPLQKLARPGPGSGKHILVGDMNLHHPAWDRVGRRSPRVEVLWELAKKWELELVTPWGEPTRVRHGHRDSTTDGSGTQKISIIWQTLIARTGHGVTDLADGAGLA